MADLYTDLYGAVSKAVITSGVPATSTSRIYYGPSITQEGSTLTRVATYTGVLGNGDVLHLCGNLVTGERLNKLDLSMSADPDTGTDTTIDIGTTTDPDGIANDSTAFQAATDVTIQTSGQAVPTLVAVKGDEYIITVTTATETSAVFTFVIETSV